jgi:hypothetical protein
MIQTVSFKGVFTLSEHIKVLGELKSLDLYAKKYDCQVYKCDKQLIHIDLKKVQKN